MAATQSMPSGASERLARDIEKLVDEAEKMVPRTGDSAEHGAAWERLSAQISAAKDELRRLEDQAIVKAKRAARVTDEVVHEHPYAAMGVAAAVGVLLGMLIARR